MDSPHQSKQEAHRAASASAPPLPGGYVLQKISVETFRLFEKAGLPGNEILDVCRKFFSKAQRTGRLKKQSFWIAKAFEKVSPLLASKPGNVKLMTFILVTDARRINDLLSLGVEVLQTECDSEFSKLPAGAFGRLAGEAGIHLSNHLWQSLKGAS